MSQTGLLIPIAAPSGTGKTTVCRALLNRSERFVFSVSCTTRHPRKNERDGVDYHFVSKPKFKAYIGAGRLAEWEKVFDNYYGTLKATLEEALAEGNWLLLDIDVKGALAIKSQYPQQTISIFLKPPNREELIRRLQQRGTDDEHSLRKRRARSIEEMNYQERFDYSIVNDKLDKTVDRIMKIIKEKPKNG